MPELPEVETVARQLNAALAGRSIRRIDILDPKLNGFDRAAAEGRSIAAVLRRGKHVAFELLAPGKPPLWLAVHLRMTGRLVFRDRWPEGADAPARAPRARFELDAGEMRFFDTRRFGSLRLEASLEDIPAPGLDPMGSAFTARALAILLRGARQPIKTWLLRQDRLCGLGNIYASEILFWARIDPRREAGTLTSEETRRLLFATRRTLRLAIRHCGVTFSDFQDSRGEIGAYQNFLRAYGRAGQPCRVCGGEIRRIVQQQRSTFFCPACQK
ncbi:MAG: Formamidopyrimidine-DNA glycosylase [candidate division BRC1 bacterium ADurb.BinA364]|nr:MAG: Formamidopyrimidine-DNA glycosylase [candidate division BRC1 bacterium ADurb.BinA364]